MTSSTRPIDWPKLLGDLAHLGLTGRELARAAGVGADAVQRWAKGSTPCRKAGENLAGLWTVMTGKPARYLPRLQPGETPRRFEVPNLDSDDEQDLAYVQIEALQIAWRRVMNQ